MPIWPTLGPNRTYLAKYWAALRKGSNFSCQVWLGDNWLDTQEAQVKKSLETEEAQAKKSLETEEAQVKKSLESQEAQVKKSSHKLIEQLLDRKWPILSGIPVETEEFMFYIKSC